MTSLALLDLVHVSTTSPANLSAVRSALDLGHGTVPVASLHLLDEVGEALDSRAAQVVRHINSNCIGAFALQRAKDGFLTAPSRGHVHIKELGALRVAQAAAGEDFVVVSSNLLNHVLGSGASFEVEAVADGLDALSVLVSAGSESLAILDKGEVGHAAVGSSTKGSLFELRLDLIASENRGWEALSISDGKASRRHGRAVAPSAVGVGITTGFVRVGFLALIRVLSLQISDELGLSNNCSE